MESEGDVCLGLVVWGLVLGGVVFWFGLFFKKSLHGRFQVPKTNLPEI